MISTVIILAAGKSSRFFPFNQHHKSLNTICGKTILEHTIDSISKTQVKKIIIVCNPKDQPAIAQITKSSKFINIVTQADPLGQADAILKAYPEVDEDCLVINSQHFYFDRLYPQFCQQIASDRPIGASLRIKTNTPSKYGMLALSGNRVKDLIEKPTPSQTPSPWRIIGVYYFTKKFLDYLKSTQTHEYQLESSIQALAQSDKFYSYETNIEPPTLKYPWDLLTLKDQILDQLEPYIDDTAQISNTSVINGKVIIKAKAIVSDFATIDGPAYLGDNSVLGSYSIARKNSVLESGSVIQRYADAKNSLLMPNSSIHSGFVGDSIIGSNSKIGASFITANRRLDRGTISIKVKNEPVDTGLTFLGTIIGPDSTLGIRVSTMPGSILGANSTVYPSLTLKGVMDNSTRLTK